MTQPQPITGQELEEIKSNFDKVLHMVFTHTCIEFGSQRENLVAFRREDEPLLREFLLDFPRCIAEIERLRAALDEISKLHPSNDQSIVAHEAIAGATDERIPLRKVEFFGGCRWKAKRDDAVCNPLENEFCTCNDPIHRSLCYNRKPAEKGVSGESLQSGGSTVGRKAGVENPRA